MAINITNATKEVLDRTERIRNFINTNCNMYNIILISENDLKEVTAIYTTHKLEMYVPDKGNAFTNFNKCVTNFTDSVAAYLSKISGVSTLKTSVDGEIYKLTKDFINDAAKIFRMKPEDYIMYILLEK